MLSLEWFSRTFNGADSLTSIFHLIVHRFAFKKYIDTQH